ncbi:uncharacterized protein LOC130998269 [Salvia miltiorrhiza]|uniref:uncharacterized protein LOC130998269 n=1 Tax=Salvia miltiorrhiza TaxID=226208 RepID=UPI0025AB5FE8|nr:uncharacterized protein LOC130998269 [Salvia miltiorrhiza]
MFTSEEWTQNKLSKEAKGKQATKIELMPSFWNNIVYTLKVMTPPVRVLQLVDGEKKPAMGYIYEAMKKAKEAIAKWDCQLHRPLHAAGHFLNPDILYDNKQLEFDMEVTRGLYDTIERLVPSKDVQDKILVEMASYKSCGGLFGSDFAERRRKKIPPAQWWRMYGHSAPNLQQLAIKILGLTCSASGCERNWSVFEQIHSKKRNRLEHKKLHDLVYVKYNQKLVERYNHIHEIDLISLNDIDECNEWLVGEVDDENDARNDLVFESDSLNWDTVYEASGAGELATYTRRAIAGKRKQSKGKELERVLEDEELDDEDEVDENDIDEESEGEEEEGFAPLDDDEEDDYVDVDEED